MNPAPISDFKNGIPTQSQFTRLETLCIPQTIGRQSDRRCRQILGDASR